MIRLYDTNKRQKIELQPLADGAVSIYVCGPTVYDFCHVGHARCYVAFDTIVRYLRRSGLDVTYVRNITDIDDKIINRARELGEESSDVSTRFSDAFRADMELLGNRPPDVEPRVTDHLPEIIELVRSLVEGGHGYAVDGDVYFSVDSYRAYGELSGRNLDDLKAGARVEVDERKRNPLDFALWKGAKEGEPAWESPWGPGRPGWHIECSAMSGRYLGDTFDIHGGGMDLIFPHHENEIAQSRACNGPTSFARHWLHNGFINVRTSNDREEKMSKSLGNFFTIQEVCKLHDPEALRLFLLSTHYRKPINFEISRGEEGVSFPSLEDAERRLSYCYSTVARLQQVLSVGKPAKAEGDVLPPADSFGDALRSSMDDDFNTAAAVGHISELLVLANALIDQPKMAPKDVRRRTLQRIAEAIDEIRAVLGLLEREPASYLERRRDKLCALRGIDPSKVEEKIAARAAARSGKDFARADAIREELASSGVELMDRPGGTDWSVKE